MISKLLLLIGIACLGLYGFFVVEAHWQQSKLASELYSPAPMSAPKPGGSAPARAPRRRLNEGDLFGRLEIPRLNLSVMVMEGDGGQVADKAKEFLQGAYEGNDRLIRLVNHMLDISRIESGRLIFNLSEVQLEEIIRSEISGLKVLADQKNITLEYKGLPTPLPKVTVDPDRLREVINNLVGNAIKFTDKGGITIKILPRDDHLRIDCVDTGIGIATADQKKIFDKFVQLDSSTSSQNQGTGLGLYISRMMVEKMGGRLVVNSAPKKGSDFFFAVPKTGSAVAKRVKEQISKEALENPNQK